MITEGDPKYCIKSKKEDSWNDFSFSTPNRMSTIKFISCLQSLNFAYISEKVDSKEAKYRCNITSQRTKSYVALTNLKLKYFKGASMFFVAC